MNGKDLSRQLSDLPEDMIAEALEPANHLQKKRLPHRLLRIAAAVAAVAIWVTAAIGLWPREENYITGPGVLVVRAFASEDGTITEENSTILEEGISYPKLQWSLVSNQPGYEVLLSIPEEEYAHKKITFEVMVSGGALLQGPIAERDENGEFPDNYDIWKSMYRGGDHFFVNNNARLYFRPAHLNFDDETRNVQHATMKTSEALVNIIIYAGDHIVGYAVIEFQHHATDNFVGEQLNPIIGVVCARTLEIRSFPHDQDDYQKVSREYVEAQFERIKLTYTTKKSG